MIAVGAGSALACRPAAVPEGVGSLAVAGAPMPAAFADAPDLRPIERTLAGGSKAPPPPLAELMDERRRDAQQELDEALARAEEGPLAPIAIVERPTELRDAPSGPVIGELLAATEFGSPKVLAVVGHRGRWLEVMAAELSNGETGWIPADVATLDATAYELRASLSARTLDVYREGELVRSVTVAIGGPATPTPTGTFAVTDKLRVTEEGSPYGCCALAFTGHQPNIAQGWSGGDRLAVHATPHSATIGAAASLGCFRAAEADMRWLVDEVPLGTRVTIEP